MVDEIRKQDPVGCGLQDRGGIRAEGALGGANPDLSDFGLQDLLRRGSTVTRKPQRRSAKVHVIITQVLQLCFLCSFPYPRGTYMLFVRIAYPTAIVIQTSLSQDVDGALSYLHLHLAARICRNPFTFSPLRPPPTTLVL